jgi:succinate dehydrogenase/fumarate reductase-like Fe-S protein
VTKVANGISLPSRRKGAKVLRSAVRLHVQGDDRQNRCDVYNLSQRTGFVRCNHASKRYALRH